jgi:antitoxin MazE
MQVNLISMFDMLKTPIRSDAMMVFRWGNSPAVRLPAAIVDALGLKEGDDINVHVANARTTLDAAQEADRKEGLNRLRCFRGMMPADFKFDRDDANARRRP